VDRIVTFAIITPVVGGFRAAGITTTGSQSIESE